jgi:UPF0755 protein
MKRWIIIILAILVLGSGVMAYVFYTQVYADNVTDSETGLHELYVKSSWNYDSLTTALYPILNDYNSFNRLAQRMNLPNKVIPGKYVIADSLGNRPLIQQLRSGTTQDVEVVLTGTLTRERIIPTIASYLEVDSVELQALLSNTSVLDSLGFNQENWPCLFVANTYRFNWAASAKDVVERFVKERAKFWSGERTEKAKLLGLSKNQVIILASIVDGETTKFDEMARIAGLYLNRLEMNMLLQSDPTVRYLMPESYRQRVTYADLERESPYNTYRNVGLPPGPILLPSVQAIDAVLNAENHNFIFMCAKPDFSGYHSFAKTLGQHNRNKALYTRELNRRGIYR